VDCPIFTRQKPPIAVTKRSISNSGRGPSPDPHASPARAGGIKIPVSDVAKAILAIAQNLLRSSTGEILKQ
jgi:hypothetical protein